MGKSQISYAIELAGTEQGVRIEHVRTQSNDFRALFDKRLNL